MSTSGLLATAVGIILREKMLLVCLNSKDLWELPGFFIAKAEEVVLHLNEFLSNLNLTELPQQTLYLSDISLTRERRKKVTGLVRIIHFQRDTQIELSKCQYQPIKLLAEDARSTGLTKALAHWLTRAT